MYSHRLFAETLILFLYLHRWCDFNNRMKYKYGEF